MQRSASDWIGNIAAFLLAIAFNVMANAIPLGGQNTGEISARYPSLFTPAGFTFGIWSLIYLTLLIFVVWQALPAQRGNEKLSKIGTLFKLNCAANALWIVVWHYNLLFASIAVMLFLLYTLIAIYRRLGIVDHSAGIGERLVLQLPFSLYTGWISVATIANISAVQNGMGWDDLLLTATSWTLAKLALAGAVGAAVLTWKRDLVFGAVIAWAAYGISVKQAATPMVAGAATTVCWLTLGLMALVLARRS